MSFLNGSSRAGLQINEISGIMDGSNGCVVVELRNAGTEPEPLADLRIADGKGGEFVIAATESVPPAGVALFIFSGPGSENHPEMPGDVPRVRFTDAPAGTVFRGVNGECALYAPRRDGEADELLSFVRWDSYPTSGGPLTETFKTAAEKGLWSKVGGNFIQVWTEDDGIIRYGGSRPRLPPGGSISRMQHVNMPGKRSWLLNPPCNTSLGRDNPPPIVYVHYTKSSGSTGVPYRLTCSAAGYLPSENTKFRFQIATDREFKGMVRDELSQKIIAHTFDTEGTYYWRVRLEEGPIPGNWYYVPKIEITKDPAQP